MPVDDANSKPLVYLFGIAGHPELSPAMQAVSDAGWNVVVPDVPGFDGTSGFTAPDEFLDWITIFWDAIDATEATPCPVVGASLGGLIAAEFAALRPEAVSKLALLSPLGIFDESNPGIDVYAIPRAERPARLFAKGVPDAHANRFAHLGEEEGPIAAYLSDVAAANLLWPFGDRGTRKRLHRITAPQLRLFGGQDELVPPATADAWGGGEVIDGAGHLMEWDVPEIVAQRLLNFLGES